MNNPRSHPGEKNPAFRHGHTTGKFSPTYQSWCSMIQRCTNPNRESWPYYGGRGITVCPRWMSFDNFLEDMGERPPGLSLDRIDNDGNYEPGNCRWATPEEQHANRRAYTVTPEYRAQILALVKEKPRSIPELVSVMKLHPEVVKKEVRKLRAAGVIETTPVPGSPGSRGRTLECTLSEENL